MIFDTLDGRLARLTKTESAFGKEYDSLADMVAFGLAPAILLTNGASSALPSSAAIGAGSAGWRVFSMRRQPALRLARFNARSATADKRYFEGLPSPSAAAIVAAFIWFAERVVGAGADGAHWRFMVTAFAGGLMVSSFSFPSFKQFNLDRRIKVFLHPARADVFRADRARTGHDAAVHVWNLRAFGARVLGRPPYSARHARRAGGRRELTHGGLATAQPGTLVRWVSMSGYGVRGRWRACGMRGCRRHRASARRARLR